MDRDRSQALFGNPYVGWSPRPPKNGQLPACGGPGCAMGIGRKVGAAMKRLPQLYSNRKAKEQIIEKWDPVSRRLVTIHPRANPAVTYTVDSYAVSVISSVNIRLTLHRTPMTDCTVVFSYIGAGAQISPPIPMSAADTVLNYIPGGGIFTVISVTVTFPNGTTIVLT